MLTPSMFGGYFIKIQNKITKLFKHTSFILRNMDVKKQSEEDKKKWYSKNAQGNPLTTILK